MNEKLKELWKEKQHYDQHTENPALQAQERDSIAGAILNVSKETTMLTAEDMEAVNWAQKRLGV